MLLCDGDGKLQKISQFDSERVPVSLGIVLDTSGSMAGEKMSAAQDAVRRFLDAPSKVRSSPVRLFA